MINFQQILQEFLNNYISIPNSNVSKVNNVSSSATSVGNPIINIQISFSTKGATYPMKAIGTSVGFVVEETIAKLVEAQFKNYFISHQSQFIKQGLISQGVTYKNGIHNTTASAIDFSFLFDDNGSEIKFLVDSKAEKKRGNLIGTKHQYAEINNKNAYIIYVVYEFVDTGVSIQSIQVLSMKQAFDNNVLRLKTTNAKTTGVKEGFVYYFKPDNMLRVELLEYKKNNIIVNIFRHKRTLDETLQYLGSPEALLEAKKRVQVKKFIEQNFNKKGDYVFPKDGNSKCCLHQEYDKGLLRFFAEHGITKIMSAYGNEVPSLGYSASEKKWYGWSHRAIYGFKVGDKIKKGTCGYEEMKKRGLLNIKTEEQAKEVAKIFAEDVS